MVQNPKYRRAKECAILRNKTQLTRKAWFFFVYISQWSLVTFFCSPIFWILYQDSPHRQRNFLKGPGFQWQSRDNIWGKIQDGGWGRKKSDDCWIYRSYWYRPRKSAVLFRVVKMGATCELKISISTKWYIGMEHKSQILYNCCVTMNQNDRYFWFTFVFKMIYLSSWYLFSRESLNE